LTKEAALQEYTMDAAFSHSWKWGIIIIISSG
jgi:hypothetical protein